MIRLSFAALLVLSACASTAQQPHAVTVSAGEVMVESEFQKQLVLEQRFIDEHRLKSIRFRITRGAAPFCRGRTRPDYGLTVATEDSFGVRQRALVRRAFGFDDHLRVLYVVAGSPAYDAGLRSGDVITRLNGAPTPRGRAGEAAFAALTEGADAGPLTLNLDGSNPRAVTIEPAATCDFDIEQSSMQTVNAYPTGGRVVVTKGMMWFASDSELALVVSHELAHLVMNHGDLSRRLAANFREIEAEADYVGLYIMARAGYEVDRAPKFWRRIAANFPRTMASARTHPATPYRFVAMKKTVAEINAKIAAGEPLTPNVGRILADASGLD
ncbi:MAG: M48 family metalloprotease [Alphaproteobacteria bacterium]